MFNQANQFQAAFENEKEAGTFTNLILQITNYSNINDYYAHTEVISDTEVISHGSFGKVYKVQEKGTKNILDKKVLLKEVNGN